MAKALCILENATTCEMAILRLKNDLKICFGHTRRHGAVNESCVSENWQPNWYRGYFDPIRLAQRMESLFIANDSDFPATV